MKYAFYPGCVARGGAPELYQSTLRVAEELGLELVEVTKAACTGAGVLQEKNRKLGDILNVRTLALAEQIGSPLLTICSTCQGVFSQVNYNVKKNPEYLEELNGHLAEEGLKYSGNTEVKHLMWAILEDIGTDKLKKHITRRFPNLSLAPFYGCYVVRPTEALGYDKYPGRKRALEDIIELVGARVVDFKGKTACCGLPILLINQENSLKMVSNHTGTARDLGANAMVTPCPLCHLNLDGYQDKARVRNRGDRADLPIIHLPQLLALAMGIPADELGLKRHFVSTKDFVDMLGTSSQAVA